MSEPSKIYVCRGMEEVGAYSVQEAVRLLELGTLKETDFYFHEGMLDVGQLAQLKASEAHRQLTDEERSKAFVQEASEAICVMKIEDLPAIDEERRKAIEEEAEKSICITRAEDLPDWLRRPQ